MAHKRILVISDMHIPYQHQDAIKFLSEIKKQFKPDTIINIGDMLDFHAISMHTHDPDLYSAGMELDRSKEYVKQLESIFPQMVEVDSNHSSLVYRRALKYGMSRQFLKDYGDFLGTKKWKWVDDLTLTMSNGQRCFFYSWTKCRYFKGISNYGYVSSTRPLSYKVCYKLLGKPR